MGRPFLILTTIGLSFLFIRLGMITEQAVDCYSKGPIGIDISHYQGKIDWDKANLCNVKFVFVRATMGSDGIDKYYGYNIGSIPDDVLVGAYHYYRPNENSTLQFNNFSSIVNGDDLDLPIVLDIEEMSRYGIGNLRKGIGNWLGMAEAEYGAKPIIYTGRNFYERHLKGHFDEYEFWIADYSSKPDHIDWVMHQYTDSHYLRGIGNVDANVFKESFINRQLSKKNERSE